MIGLPRNLLDYSLEKFDGSEDKVISEGRKLTLRRIETLNSFAEFNTILLIVFFEHFHIVFHRFLYELILSAHAKVYLNLWVRISKDKKFLVLVVVP